jgi:hypothetical protein
MKYLISCLIFLATTAASQFSQESPKSDSTLLFFAVPAGREQSLSGVFKSSIGGNFYNAPEPCLHPPVSVWDIQGWKLDCEKAKKEPPRVNVSPAPIMIVRSKPYSAEEVIQELWMGSDGIQRSQTLPAIFIYRDSIGRIRVDGPACFPGSMVLDHNKLRNASKAVDRLLEVMGGVLVDEECMLQPSSVIPEIIDPVAGYRYYINNLNKVAYRFALPPSGAYLSSNISQKPMHYESLGAKIINGMDVHGIGFSTIIDGPQKIITESWVSNELMIGIFRKTTTPIKGEIIQTLKNIKRTEPDDSLFKIPSDYAIKDIPDQSQ